MATMDDLIVSIEVELEQAQKRRNADIETVKVMLSKVNKEGKAGFTAEEREECERLQERAEAAEGVIAEIEGRLAMAQRAKENEMKIRASEKDVRETSAAKSRPAYDRVARVGREERTYHEGNDRKGREFLNDVIRAFQRDPESEYRLIQHRKEELVERGSDFRDFQQRAAGTGAFAGLTVPQYLTDMYAPRAQAMRPFADICNRHDLPSQGMTVNISRITTGTSADLQSSENSAVSETNIDDTLLTENVQTVAGQQTLSRQAIDRGTGIEDVVLDDLYRAHASKLDSTLITQATTGLSAVAQDNAYTDASPTGGELYPKFAAAMSGLEAAVLGFAQPTHAVMHPRRWYWLQKELTSTWPAFTQPGIDPRALGTNNGAGYNAGIRGVLPNGLAVVTDNNIATNLGAGTNEDEIYVVADSECHLWEQAGSPMFIRAEQPSAASLGVLLVVWSYFAYSFRRYTNAVQAINGTGLVTPTF